MHVNVDWLPGGGTRPGSAGAKAAPQPGSRGTESLLVSPKPGWRDAR
jgi:hypothetical protein